MPISTVALSNTVDTWRVRFNEMVAVSNAQISDTALLNLETSEKTTIWGAVNELVSNSLAKTGAVASAANQPMGGFVHTNVGNATARSNYPSLAQIQDGDIHWLGTVSGTANALTATAPFTLPALKAGQCFAFIVGLTNTLAATLDISNKGAKSILKLGQALVAGDLTVGDVVIVWYSGTAFWMISPARTPVLTDGAIPIAKISGSLGLTNIGEVYDWGGDFTNVPGNDVVADGSLYDPAEYPDLFAVYGTRHGGNGTTTFGVPDLRDKFVVGARQDDAGKAKTLLEGVLRQSGGAYDGFTGGFALTSAHNGPHTHTLTTDSNSVAGLANTNSGPLVKQGTGITLTTNSSGSGTAHEHPLDAPPYYAMVKVVRTGV